MDPLGKVHTKVKPDHKKGKFDNVERQRYKNQNPHIFAPTANTEVYAPAYRKLIYFCNIGKLKL